MSDTSLTSFRSSVLWGLVGLAAVVVTACGAAETGSAPAPAGSERMRVILDTDANNELDDQHAIAYLLFNGDVFDVEGITVNRTRGGGDIHQQKAEAERVVALAGLRGRIPVYAGADGSFDEIRKTLDRSDFDGAEAVNFIIERARSGGDRQLVLLPVGKLTNIALALEKAPDIASRVRVVWLGSNYPDPGEYNQDNDESAVQYLLDSKVPFEIALVRYGKDSGTDAVRVTPQEIRKRMAGRGPPVSPPVTGRHGGAFSRFGDYSISLFEHIELDGDPPSRALYDMAAVAIVKNPAWAQSRVIPAPKLVEGRWIERPENDRTVMLWERFDREAILADFFARMERYQLARPAAAVAAN
ncbi:MAG TPA: nucleoside hydrolase [Vicinamibacterales bacterium]|nr:nucleoside hydrolase [Vicinamibacterales bacterium]